MHDAEAQVWCGENRAACNACGWVQARARKGHTRSAKQARAAAERHNRDRAKMDADIERFLWGSRRPPTASDEVR